MLLYTYLGAFGVGRGHMLEMIERFGVLLRITQGDTQIVAGVGEFGLQDHATTKRGNRLVQVSFPVRVHALLEMKRGRLLEFCGGRQLHLS